MSLRRGRGATEAGTTAVALEDRPPFDVDGTDVPTSDPGVLPIGMGWDAAEEVRSSDGKFADRLKLSSSPVLVKFLADKPFSWSQHFIKSVNKPYVCIRKSDPRGCPLCSIGDVPKARHMMSVADLSGEVAVVKKLEFGNRLLDALQKVHQGPKGPLTRFCIRLSSSGTGFDIQYDVDVVKDRDLEEEEEITPEEVAEEIKDLKPLGADSIFVSKYEDLVEVAESLV